jgi:hypothetical protein
MAEQFQNFENPYGKPHLIPNKLKFKGEIEECISFVEKFRQLVNENNWDIEHAKWELVMSLNGKAADWYRLWKTSNIDTTIEETLDSLTKRFQSKYSNEYYIKQLQSCKQGSRPVHEFETEIIDLMLKAFEGLKPDERIIKTAITNGLNHELRKALILIEEENNFDYEKYFTMAKKIESKILEPKSNEKSKPNKWCGFCKTKTHNEEDCFKKDLKKLDQRKNPSYYKKDEHNIEPPKERKNFYEDKKNFNEDKKNPYDKKKKFDESDKDNKNAFTFASQTQTCYLNIKTILGTESKMINTLLDSGAACNMITKKLTTKLKKIPCQESLITVAGEPCYINSKVMVELNIKNKPYMVEMNVIPNLPVEMILGFQWMKENLAYIDFEKKIVKLKEFQEETQEEQKILEEATIIKNILKDYQDIFQNELTSCTSKVQHQIILKQDSRPIRQKVHKIGENQRISLEKQLKDLLRRNIIEPSNSPWASPITMVPKNGDYRLCGDYRRLNNITIHDSYPLPNIEDILNSLAGATIFSTMDAISGYHQIAMEDKDKEKTAFICHKGLFQFKRMPFGLVNSGATFQRMMDTELEEFSSFVKVYVDDIIVFSKTIKEHENHLRTIFQKLRNIGLKLKESKCRFMLEKIKFLSHEVSKDGIRPTMDKIDVIKKISPPKNSKQVMKFLGTISWYRRFIQDFAKIAMPLQILLKKNSIFEWKESQQNAFNELVKKLASQPILKLPNFAYHFILQTDASDISIGACIGQEQEGQFFPIAYASRGLSRAERNYSTIEKEALAIFWAITKKFKEFTLGSKFILNTDHKPLEHLLKMKNPNNRILRWIAELQQFSFTIKYIPGEQNNIADALSRIEWPIINTEEEDQNLFVAAALTLKSMQQSQTEDHSLDIYRREIVPMEKIHSINPGNIVFTLIDGILYRISRPRIKHQPDKIWKQVIVPTNLRKKVFEELHENELSAHLGFEKTYHKINSRFYWKNMSKEIKNWIKHCTLCQMISIPNHQDEIGYINSIPVLEPWHTIGMDIVGPLPTSNRGNKYILTMMDYLTKWPEAFAIPDQKTETIAKIFVEEIYCRQGAPVKIITDMGTNFMSGFFQDVCRILKIEKIHTTAYNPRGNGLVERFNKTLGSALKKSASANHKDWDIRIPFILFAYRTSMQSSAKTSPFMLMYGREPKLPIDIMFEDPNEEKIYDPEDYRKKMVDLSTKAREIARDSIQLEQVKSKHLADKGKFPLQNFKKGELVLLKNEIPESKLDKPWIGPYIIKEIEEYGNLLISHQQIPKDVQLVNARRVKKFFINEKEEISYNKEKEEEEFEVEKILKERGKDENLEYLVRWKNYSSKFDEWIKANDKNNKIDDLIKDWKEKNLKKKKRNREIPKVALKDKLAPKDKLKGGGVRVTRT